MKWPSRLSDTAGLAFGGCVALLVNEVSIGCSSGCSHTKGGTSMKPLSRYKAVAFAIAPLFALLSALVGVQQVASAATAQYGTDVALASAGAAATSSGREVPTALGPE